MKKDWSISWFPSGSTRLNLKDRLPPCSPFSWPYCSRPAEEPEEPVQNENTADKKNSFSCSDCVGHVVGFGGKLAFKSLNKLTFLLQQTKKTRRGIVGNVV